MFMEAVATFSLQNNKIITVIVIVLHIMLGYGLIFFIIQLVCCVRTLGNFFFRSRNGTWSLRHQVMTPLVSATASISLIVNTVLILTFRCAAFPNKHPGSQKMSQPSRRFSGVGSERKS